MFSGSNNSEVNLNAQLSFFFYSVSPQQYLCIYLKPKNVFSNWLVIIKCLEIPSDFHNWWTEKLGFSIPWNDITYFSKKINKTF